MKERSAAVGLMALLCGAWGTVGALSAQEARHALVIGNNDYANARKLVNPTNDAKVIAKSLTSLGFEVMLRTDADLKTMKAAVREFIQTLSKDSVALVFYAGHGVEVKGRNYLVPIDAGMAEEFEVPDETLPMDTLLRGLEQAGASLNILVLDCCRDDPYSRSWRGSRSAAGGGGLSMPADMPQGMFIAFSTTPGKTAEDGDGANSPYTSALAEEILKPGQELERVFKNVGARVAKSTEQRQEPWSNSKFYGTFLFNPAKGVTPDPVPTPVKPGPPGGMKPVVPAPAAATTPRRILPEPPFQAQLAADPEASSRVFPKLKQLSAKKNEITDEERWIEENQIPPLFLKVPNPFMQQFGELPANVPARLDNLMAVRAFHNGDHSFVIYGENFSSGVLLAVWNADFTVLEGEIDFQSYRRAPKVLKGDENYVDQALRFAAIQEGILYVSNGHSTYAKSSGGMNAYLTAIRLATGEVLWRSAPLVSNCSNFVLSGDGIITGYGFTEEDDYLYVLDRHTGKTVTKQLVKSGPERLALIGKVLHVRTYNTDYQFRVE